MPWVRFDDQYPDHPKIGPLTDRLYRLHNAAIFWSARHTTDGVIRAEQLTQIRAGARPRDAAELVRRRLLHAAGEPECPSQQCPPAGPDGWVIHDYWDYQPSRKQVLEERRARAERQRRWREKTRGRNTSTPDTGDGAVDPLLTPEETRQRRVSNGPVDTAPYPPPPRPAPKEAGGGAPRSSPGGPEPPAAASSAGGAAAGADQPQRPPRPAPPPADQLAAARAAIAAGHTRLNAAGHRRQNALAELRQATPDVPIPADQEGPET